MDSLARLLARNEETDLQEGLPPEERSPNGPEKSVGGGIGVVVPLKVESRQGLGGQGELQCRSFVQQATHSVVFFA